MKPLLALPPIVSIKGVERVDAQLTHTWFYRKFGEPNTLAELEWDLDDLLPGEWSWKLHNATMQRVVRVVQFRCRRCERLCYFSLTDVTRFGTVRKARLCGWHATPKVRCSLQGHYRFDRFVMPKQA